MKGIRAKLTAVLLTITFIASLTAFAQDDKTYSSGYEKAVNVLKSIGIIEEEDFLEDTLLTRAEAAVMLTRLISSDEEISSVYNDVAALYTDVDASHWAVEAIYFMTAKKIINGYENKTFEPEREVQYQEFVKMMVSVLGYNQKAEVTGGYPVGYLTTALEIKLLNNINVQTGVPVTQGLAAQMIFNSLEIPLSIVTSMGQSTEYATVDKSITILNKHLKIYKAEGVYTADAYSVISEAFTTELKDGRILIDDTLYYVDDDVETDGLLGMCLEIYYKQDDNSDLKTIIYAANKYREGVLEIKYDKIYPDTTNEKINYEDKNGKKKTVSIPANIDIVYNNKFYTKGAHFPLGGFLIDLGYIRLIDNDNDGKYDVALVFSYDTYIVDNVKPLDELIYLKHDKPSVDLYGDKGYKVIKDGELSSISYAKEWDVLSVMTDKSGDVRQIIISSETARGEVSEVIQSTEGNSYVIGDKTYKLSPQFEAAKNKNIQVGVKIVAYLDVFGNIAAVDGIYNTSKFYGYLMQVETTGNISSEYKMKIFNSDDEFVVYSLAKNVDIDGILIKTASESDKITSMLKSTGVSENGGAVTSGVCQIIAYEINGNNEIFKIDTVADNVPIDEDDLKQDYFLVPPTSTGAAPADADVMRYQKNGQAFVNAKRAETGFMIDSMSVIFVVPGNDKTNEKLYALATSDYFVEAKYYNLEAYNVDKETNMAGVVVYEDTLSASGSFTLETTQTVPLMLVDKVTRTTEDGESLYKVYGWRDGKYDFFYADSEARVAVWDFRWSTNNSIKQSEFNDIADSKIKMGDLVVVAPNAQKRAKSIVKWMPSDTDNGMNNMMLETESDFAYQVSTYNDKVYGTVVRCNNKVITINSDKITIVDELDQSGKVTGNKLLSREPIVCNYNVETFKPFVYKYDAATKKTELATISDVTAWQKVFVRVRFGEIKDIIIYANLDI